VDLVRINAEIDITNQKVKNMIKKKTFASAVTHLSSEWNSKLVRCSHQRLARTQSSVTKLGWIRRLGSGRSGAE
jgi:hypothetical protein